MQKLVATLVVGVLGLSLALTANVYAQEFSIPSWIKTTALWWGEGKISDQEFVNALQYMVTNKIITIPGTGLGIIGQAGKIFDHEAGELEIGMVDNVSKISKFDVFGNPNEENYLFELELVDATKKNIAADGTVFLVIKDRANHSLYQGTFSVSSDDFSIIYAVTGEKYLVYSWDLPVSEIRRGLGTFGTATLVFTDSFGKSFVEQHNTVLIPHF